MTIGSEAAEPGPVAVSGAGRSSGRSGHTTFPGLDGLRAVAVLAVVTTHAAFWTGRYERGWGSNAFARLDCGVAVFFVLSGFLLVRPWLVSGVEGRALPSLRTYTVRRIARIMPAYTAAVVLCFLLLAQNQSVGVWDWIRHLTLTQTLQGGLLRAGLTQTWSLCTEASFYVLLPVLGLLLVRASRVRWRPGLLCALFALGAVVPVPWYLFAPRGDNGFAAATGYWLPGYAGWFAGGMVLAIVRTHLDRRPPPSSSRWWIAEHMGRHPFTCWSVAATAFFAAMTPIAGPRLILTTSAAESITKQTLYLVVAMALVWPAVFGQSPLTRAVLGNRVMRYAGDISYGVFLYHLLVLQGVVDLLGKPLFTGRVSVVLPLTLLGSSAVAAISFRYLERPFMARAHRSGPLPIRRGAASTEHLPPNAVGATEASGVSS